MRFRTFCLSTSLFAALCACNDKPDRPVSTLGEKPVATTPAATPPAPAPAPVPAPAPAPVAVATPDAGVGEPAMVVPDSFADRVKLARELIKDGKTIEGISMYNRALELEDSAAVHIDLARILILDNDVRKAAEQADFALKLAPSSSAAWNTKGRVLFLSKDLDGAHDAFAKAVELNDDNVWAWNNKGLVEMEQGEWTEAIASLERATSGELAETYMFVNLGRAYEHEKRTVEALAMFKVAAARGSDVAKEALGRLADDKSAKAPTAPPQ
jgi:tetratricopeptide (TPR) repeat protein